MKQYNLEILSFSEKGLRVKNEDKVYHELIGENSNLLLLADGMGGYENGEAAATTAIEVISKRIIESDTSDIKALINESFSAAHNEIVKNYSEAGATICGILIRNDEANIFWSGDVKVFIVNGDNTFATSEHTLLNLLQSAKTIIKGEEIPRLKNTVTRAVGGKLNSFLPEQVHLQLSEHYKILICSDGVHQLFTNEEIFDILRFKRNIEAFNNIKTRAFYQSKDNYSAIFAEKK